MASEPPTPNFGELLRPVLGDLPDTELPAFLARLERGAADRYRAWAEASEDADEARGLLACAEREDEIARRVEKLFPVGEEAAARHEARLPEARRLYLSVFESHPLREQYRIQADAERQGAAAWRSLATSQSDPEVVRELGGCAELEERSADWLDDRLGS